MRAQADQGALGEAELGQAGQRGQVQLQTEAEVVVCEVERGEGGEAAGGEVTALPPPHPHQLSPGHLHTSLVQLSLCGHLDSVMSTSLNNLMSGQLYLEV